MQWAQKKDIIQYMVDRNLTVPFSNLSIGTVFHFNGSLWQKRSTRTAHVFGMPHRWFYFGNKDIVES